MKLNNYLVNKTLYFHTLKQHLLLAKISLMTFGVMVLTSLALREVTFIFPTFVFLASCVALPICYPIIIYDYLHDTTKASHLRSLPLKMSCVFTTYLCAGLTLVLGVLMAECVTLLALGNYFVEMEFLFMVPFLAIYYFVFGLLANLLAGTKRMSFILTIVIYGFPFLLVILLSSVSIHHAFGLQMMRFNEDLVYLFMPLFSGFEFLNFYHEWPYFVSHVTQLMMALGLSYVLMKYRREEEIGDSFVVKQASLVVRLAILIVLTSGLYLLTSQSIMTQSFTEYLFRLDTLFIASGCLCAILIELLFSKSIQAKTLVRAYLPTIALMVFGMHFIGNQLTNPSLIDRYELARVHIYDENGSSYSQLMIDDTKELVEMIFEDYKNPETYYKHGRVLIDIDLMNETRGGSFNYEFILEKDQFDALLKQSQGLRSVYYDQGLNEDRLSKFDTMVAQNYQTGDYTIIQDEKYLEIVEKMRPYFKNNNSGFMQSHDEDDYLIYFYKDDALLFTIDRFSSAHPLIQAIESGRYNDESYDEFFKKGYALIMSDKNYESFIDDSSLLFEIKEVTIDKYVFDTLSLDSQTIVFHTMASITMYSDDLGSDFTYEPIQIIVKKDKNKVYIDHIELNKNFYESWGGAQ